MFTKKTIFRIGSILVLIMFMLSVTPLQAVHAAGVFYAAPDGTGDCSSWEDACNLQTALSNATSGDEIWVKAGMYKPTDGTNRWATFQLKSGVAVYGGFAGNETSRSQRDPYDNQTTLSGDIGAIGDSSDNSDDVVTGSGTDATAVLDGFTISDGNANCPCSGGGMYNNAGSPTLANLIFSGNSAGWGGGMYNTSSSPTLTDITFSGNSATTSGGGLYNESGSSPKLMNVTFSGNSSTNNGGGMANTNASNPTLTNVTFNSNNAHNHGGGIYNDASSPTLTNVTFISNQADTFNGIGGGMYNYSSSPTLTDVTFCNNYAFNTGGGMNNDASSSPQIRNTIFWGNTAYGDGAQIYNADAGSTPTVTSSVVQDGYTGGTNIITSDPKLGMLGNYGGFTQTIPLLAGSSAIDAGDDAVCPANDQRGVMRPQGLHCDIGAYEQYTGIYHVKPAASGMGNCQSWADACTLQNALGTAYSGNEIWAAAGTYKPTTDPTNRDATFQLIDGVALYGGFSGTESERDQRDPVANLTILSGDIDNNDSQTPIITDPFTVTGNTTNSQHVVIGAAGATLDGFTITSGYASYYGGGMYNSIYSHGSSIINVTFIGNVASEAGGGMANRYGSNPILTNVTFIENRSAVAGGGMFNENSSNPSMTNVTFTDNSAYAAGGGMYNENSSNPSLTNVTFSVNTSGLGGGMYNDNSSNPSLTNVTFSDNSANGGSGGGMYNVNSFPTLTNVTFSGNSAAYGGGMDNYSNSSPMIRNTIFWGNTAATSGAQIYNADAGSTPNVSYCVVQDVCPSGSTCTNLVTADPLLGTLGNYGGFTQTIPLLAGSSAIDTGDNSVCPATDQRGVSRPQGAFCDIGAYEYVDTTAPTVTAFTATSPSNSLNIPITAFSASDNVGVTGYLITTSSTQPAADATSWTGSPPATYPVASDGSYTLYPWAKDAAGNVSAKFASPPTVVVDTTPPTVVSSLRLNPSPTNLASVAFTVTFSEPVTGVEASDFRLATTGISDASVSGISGSGSVYTVTVNTGSGNGTLRLDVPSGATVTDLAGNPLAGLPYTSGETYTVNKAFSLFLPLILR